MQEAVIGRFDRVTRRENEANFEKSDDFVLLAIGSFVLR